MEKKQEFKQQQADNDTMHAKGTQTTQTVVSRSDYKFGIIAGLITSLLVIPIIINLGVFQGRLPYLIPALIIFLPISWTIGLLIVHKISGRFVWIYQAAKFAIVGFLNTTIDFGILNFLSWITGIYSGKQIIVLNSIAFVFAITNSYFWNKYWTFSQHKEVRAGEFAEFVAVGMGGLIINTSIVFGITTYAPLFNGMDPALLENVAKIFATAVALIWNFVGYKFIVFKS